MFDHSKRMTFTQKLLLIFFSTVLYAASAQNTIGGEAKLVPEDEVDRQSQFVDAERERVLQHWDKALGLYKSFLRENAENDAAWFGTARCQFAKQDFNAALDAINKAVAFSPSNQWYRVLQADIYDQLGRTKDAAAVFAELSKMYPQTREFYEKQAYYYVLSGDPQSALKALDQLEKITGITEATSMRKHTIYLGMKDNKRAAAELVRLADAYPYRLEYRHQLAKFYTENGDKSAARKTYEDILRRNPDDREAQLALLERDKNTSESAYLQTLLPLFRDATAPIGPKAQEISPYLAKLTPADPNGPVLLQLGEALEQAHPNDATAFSISGGVLYQLGRYDEALAKYRQCIRLNPNVFEAWANTLSLLERQKKYDELLKTAEEAMDAFPNQPMAYLYYGVAATEKGKYDDAVGQMDQALIMAGNSPLRLDLLDQIGIALTRKKDYAGAAKRFELALSKGGDKHAGVLEHYGDLLSAQNDKAAARTYWQKAYDISKDPAILEKLK